MVRAVWRESGLVIATVATGGVLLSLLRRQLTQTEKPGGSVGRSVHGSSALLETLLDELQ